MVLRVCGRMRDVVHKHKEWRDLDLSSESERERAQKHTHRPISSCCGSQSRGLRLVACCHTFPVVTNKKKMSLLEHNKVVTLLKIDKQQLNNSSLLA